MDTKPRFQFSLKTMFIAVAVIAIAIPLAPLLLALAIYETFTGGWSETIVWLSERRKKLPKDNVTG